MVFPFKSPLMPSPATTWPSCSAILPASSRFSPTFSIDPLGCLDVDMRLTCFWSLYLFTTSNKRQPPIRYRSRQSMEVGISRYLRIDLALTAQWSPSQENYQHLVTLANLIIESFGPTRYLAPRLMSPFLCTYAHPRCVRHMSTGLWKSIGVR